MDIKYADMTPYWWREIIKVLSEQREFHEDETLLRFQNMNVLELGHETSD
jgi:hypothetical protein